MSGEFEDNHTQAEHDSLTTGLSGQPRWLRVGLGLLGVILILALAWPGLRTLIGRWPGLANASLTELEQAAAAEPGNETLQYELAGAYYQARRFEDAWARFRTVEAYQLVADAPEILEAEQAVQAAPSSTEAHFKLGTVWARAQLLMPAEIAYRQAIALDNENVDAHTNLGVVYYQMGRLSEALSEYDAALAVSPDDADVLYNKGAALVQQALQVSPTDETLLDQGVAQFQRALEINPNLSQAHFSLGVVYATRGQTQSAISEFQRFLELDDGSDPEATTAAQTYLTQLEE